MRRPFLAVSFAVLLVACDKGKEGSGAAAGAPASPASASAPSTPPPPPAPAPTPSAVASATPPPAPPPKCPAGMTANATPPYCIKLPASYSVKEARVLPARGTIDYDTGTTTDHLTITYDSMPIAELAKQVEGEMKFGADKLEKKGDLPGGNKWFQGSHAEYARVVTLVGAPPLTLKCSFAYQPKKPPPAGAIDACKTLAKP